jgi:hypothetical protein
MFLHVYNCFVIDYFVAPEVGRGLKRSGLFSLECARFKDYQSEMFREVGPDQVRDDKINGHPELDSGSQEAAETRC